MQGINCVLCNLFARQKNQWSIAVTVHLHPLPHRHFNLNKSANTIAPSSPPSVRPVSSAFHRQYGCSRCVYGKRETGAKREKLVLGSSLRSRLKILLFARYPSPVVPLFSPRSFSLPLSLRSFLLAFSGSPLCSLACTKPSFSGYK